MYETKSQTPVTKAERRLTILDLYDGEFTNEVICLMNCIFNIEKVITNNKSKILNLARSSFGGSNNNTYNILNSMSKICCESAEYYIQRHYAIEAFSSLDKYDKTLLYSYFIKGLDIDELSTKNNISARTALRHLDIAKLNLIKAYIRRRKYDKE